MDDLTVQIIRLYGVIVNDSDSAFGTKLKTCIHRLKYYANAYQLLRRLNTMQRTSKDPHRQPATWTSSLIFSGLL